MAARSYGLERRTPATVPSRSTSRVEPGSSATGGAGASVCMSGLCGGHEGDGDVGFMLPDGGPSTPDTARSERRVRRRGPPASVPRRSVRRTGDDDVAAAVRGELLLRRL